jgi:hypothetical protein
MPLLIENLPNGIEKALDASVSELIGHGALAIGSRSRPAVSVPVPVHHLGADAIAYGKGVAAAQQVGWLATLTTDGEVRGTIELVPLKAKRKGATAPQGLSFGGFTTGPLQRALAAAIEAAAKSAGKREVKLAVLRAPAVYLLALWLQGSGGDQLVPIAPAPAPLKAGESYPADRALGDLAEAAQSALGGDEARS